MPFEVSLLHIAHRSKVKSDIKYTSKPFGYKKPTNVRPSSMELGTMADLIASQEMA